MAKSDHARYVDRRLSVARQILSGIADEQASGMEAILNEASMENALLQAYFAVRHYINELLESYQYKSPNFDQWQLTESFFQEHQSVSELAEFNSLIKQPNSWLDFIVQHPERMLHQANQSASNSPQSKAQPPKTQPQDMIATSLSVVDSDDKLTLQKAKWAIQQFSDLVQRQREHLLEY